MTENRSFVEFCPHCGNRCPQRVVFDHTYKAPWYSDDGTEQDPAEGPDIQAILTVCATCDDVLLFVGMPEFDDDMNLVYPTSVSLPDSVPKTIRGIYREAVLVKRNAPNAFAIMIRKALEALCEDRGLAKGSLSVRLKQLAERNEIPPVLADATDVLRVVGNTAAHGPLQRITKPMTWAIDEFFRVIVEYVYVAPSKLAKFREKLERTSVDGNDDA